MRIPALIPLILIALFCLFSLIMAKSSGRMRIRRSHMIRDDYMALFWSSLTVTVVYFILWL